MTNTKISSKTKSVSCPHCGKAVEWKASSTWRPFCCERCKMIDLGAWADEDYKVGNESPRPMEDMDFESS